jgi:hypothetical protein
VIDGGEAPLHEHQQDARKGVRGLTETRSQGKGEANVDRGGGGGSELRRGGFGEGLTAGRGGKARVGNGAARQGVVVDNVWLEAMVHGRRWFAGVEEGGGSGVRGSGRWAGGRKCRMGWSRVGEAREQENRGPEGGARRTCHDDGELSAGRRSGRRGARGKGPAGASWGGGRRPSDAWGRVEAGGGAGGAAAAA